MELLLLGTGGPGGWPEPGCRCASCAGAVAARRFRAPTSVLVDDVLLVDPGPDAARLAAQGARDLRGVRHVLLTGFAAADAAVLGALAAEQEVEVLGLPEALHGAAGARPVAPGQTISIGSYALRALTGGDVAAWEVTGPDGTRLLHAPGGGPAPSNASYDLALVGLRGLGGWLAAQRRAGGAAADVVAVGLDHDGPPPEELDRFLGAWGARAVEDGTTVAAGTAPPLRRLHGRTLVLGGARSGKSVVAEQLLAASPDVTYVATGGRRDDDHEWRERVASHVARRPATWHTVETTDVTECLRTATVPLLVDCLGTWLAGRLDTHGVWDGGNEQPVHDDVADLVAAWRAAVVPVVAVSNEVGSGVVPATASGRRFRDLLGRLNAAVATESETVLLTVAGIAVPVRELPRP